MATEQNGRHPPDRAAEAEALVAAHQAPRLRYARRLVRDADAAEDAVQEAFLRFLPSAERGAAPEKASAWLYRVTHNLCLDRIRKETRMIGIEAIDPAAAPGPSPAEAAERAELKTRVDELLGALSENQRAVLVLKIQEGKSYREISEITGLSAGNVGFLIHRGLKKMAELIREKEII